MHSFVNCKWESERCTAADLGSSLPPHLLNSGGDCGAGLRSSLALPCHASMQNTACLATKVCQVIDDNLNEEEQIRIPARPAPVEGDVLQIRAWCGRRRRQLQNMSFPSLSFSPSFAVSFSPVRPCVTPSPLSLPLPPFYCTWSSTPSSSLLLFCRFCCLFSLPSSPNSTLLYARAWTHLARPALLPPISSKSTSLFSLPE